MKFHEYPQPTFLITFKPAGTCAAFRGGSQLEKLKGASRGQQSARQLASQRDPGGEGATWAGGFPSRTVVLKVCCILGPPGKFSKVLISPLSQIFLNWKFQKGTPIVLMRSQVWESLLWVELRGRKRQRLHWAAAVLGYMSQSIRRPKDHIWDLRKDVGKVSKNQPGLVLRLQPSSQGKAL